MVKRLPQRRNGLHYGLKAVMDLLEASHLDKNVDVAVTVKASFMPPSSEYWTYFILTFFCGRFQISNVVRTTFEI